MESLQKKGDTTDRETREAIESHLHQEWGMAPETARRFVNRQPGITLNETVEYMRAVAKATDYCIKEPTVSESAPFCCVAPPKWHLNVPPAAVRH